MKRTFRPIALALFLVVACIDIVAAAPEDASPSNSNLNGELFYRILVGELSAQSGDSGAAYSLMLDTARKANSSRLYERAVEIALTARNGESALRAAQDWARAFPASADANRYVLQILIEMNRIAQTADPLKRTLAALAPMDRLRTIGLVPRLYARASDKKLAATVVEQALDSDLTKTTTGPAAWTSIGLLRLAAGDFQGALEAARQGATLDPEAEEPAYLAIALVGPQTGVAAEALVRKFLGGKRSPEVRMAYARKLLESQRYAESYIQMQQLTVDRPDSQEAWLLRGSLELQDNKLVDAEDSLKTYVKLATSPTPESTPSAMNRGLVQAYLMLSEIAEKTKRLDQANAYLKMIDSPQDALRVQSRRAMILARQGKMDEARALIRAIPESQPTDARAKMNAEVQLLREYKQYQAAYQMLAGAVSANPQDAELVYDLATMAEKVGRLEEMEQLLRRVIASRPDFHPAYNALGYSFADRKLHLPEARQLIKKALEFAPEDPFIVDSLAWVEFRSGNSTEALRLLQGAYKARPDAEIAAHMGEVLWDLGEKTQAADIWNQGKALNPENETLLETIRRLSAKP